ncbi:MAG: TatD family deoxyribonuclease [Dehalococcoidia bacterium]|nr:TatD family deoxyribonuclease [Dehalococcoidia bacterium]
MIDCHVHLDDEKFIGDVDRIIEEAEAAGVRLMLSAGVDVESSHAVLQLAERYTNVWAAVGFHPHETTRMTQEDLVELRMLAAHPKVVAIGEIGLDFHFEHSPQDVQRRAFRQLLDLAADLALPVVVHNRDANNCMRDILGEWAEEAAGEYVGRPLGMLHCFSEDITQAEFFIERGLYLSLASPVTYPNAKATHEVAMKAPMDRLLTETDAPYLPPQGQRGQRNAPANVAAVVHRLAELREMTPAEVSLQVDRNAEVLFGFQARRMRGVR